MFRTAGENHGIKILQQLCRGDILSDMPVGAEDDPFSLHLSNAAVNQMFLHLKVRDTVAE